jgi:hypothetical protein
MTRMLLIAAVATCLTSCTKQAITYNPLDSTKVTNVQGERTRHIEIANSNQIDSKTARETKSILLAEIPRLTGIMADTSKAPVDSKVSIVVNNLKWYVPNYGNIIGQSVVTGIVGGAVGAVTYGAENETNVYGISELVMFVNTPSGQQQFTYQDTVKFPESLNKCDTHKTKAWARGAALRKSIARLVVDLSSTF